MFHKFVFSFDDLAFSHRRLQQHAVKCSCQLLLLAELHEAAAVVSKAA
jgi:hypothetical protein